MMYYLSGTSRRHHSKGENWYGWCRRSTRWYNIYIHLNRRWGERVSKKDTSYFKIRQLMQTFNSFWMGLHWFCWEGRREFFCWLVWSYPLLYLMRSREIAQQWVVLYEVICITFAKFPTMVSTWYLGIYTTYFSIFQILIATLTHLYMRGLMSQYNLGYS